MFHGVDGCLGGWVVASSDRWPALSFDVVSSIAPLSRWPGIVGIDIPIGLPDEGPRAWDHEARQCLGKGQGSRVYPAACRAAFGGRSYIECCQMSHRSAGTRLSRQLYGILPKIAEVDSAITPDLQGRVREVHTEVRFCQANEGALRYSKKTPEGQRERIAILAAHRLKCDWFRERLRLGARELAVDDLLDAAICLLTAKRIGDGVAVRLGDDAGDRMGLRMEIVWQVRSVRGGRRWAPPREPSSRGPSR